MNIADLKDVKFKIEKDCNKFLVNKCGGREDGRRTIMRADISKKSKFVFIGTPRNRELLAEKEGEFSKYISRKYKNLLKAGFSIRITPVMTVNSRYKLNVSLVM